MDTNAKVLVGKKRGFALDVFGWAALVVLVSGLTLVAIKRGDNINEPLSILVGYIFGGVLGGLLLGGAIGLIVYFLGRGSNRGFNVTLLVVALISVLGQLSDFTDQKANNSQTFESMMAQGRDLMANEKELLHRELNGENVDAERATLMVERMAILEEAVDESTGKQEMAMRVLVDLTQQINDLTVMLTQAVNVLIQDGVTDPAELTSKQQISQTREMVYTIQAANTDVIDFLENIDQKVLEAGKRHGLTGRDARNFATGFRESSRVDEVIEVRLVTAETCDQYLVLLDFLETHWGTWQIDALDGTAVFASNEDSEAFDRIIERLIMLSEKEEKLTLGLVQRL